MNTFAAISTGPETHLDHLAPLCFILGIPLIVSEKRQLELAEKFYPMVESRYIPLSDLTLQKMATFDAVIECGKFWAMELRPLLKLFFNHDLRVIFTPHGYSDKEGLLGMPVEQDIALNYRDMGNVRHWFYKEHREHFDRLAKGLFKGTRKKVLYAPTWKTTATSTSFFEHMESVVTCLEGKVDLLVKLHPLLEENSPGLFHHLLGKYEDRVHFLQEFPPIYPLLEKTDVYLGDFSSIGYDFLHYNRPMYFLNESRGKLQECGETFFGNVDNEQKNLRTVREKVYHEAFGKCDPEKIKTLIAKQLGSMTHEKSLLF